MRFQESTGSLPPLASQYRHDAGRATSWRQAAFLTVLTGAHVGMLWSWQPQRHASSDARPAPVSTLVFVHLTAAQPVRRKLQAEASVAPAADATRRPIPTLPAAPSITAEALVPRPPAPLPPAPTEGEPDLRDLIDRAKASARRLAPEVPPATKSEAALTLEQSLGNAIAAAARPRTTTIEELQTADGRPLSKISGPRGTYCVARDGFGPSAGRDPFRDGVRDRVVRCPR